MQSVYRTLCLGDKWHSHIGVANYPDKQDLQSVKAD